MPSQNIARPNSMDTADKLHIIHNVNMAIQKNAEKGLSYRLEASPSDAA